MWNLLLALLFLSSPVVSEQPEQLYVHFSQPFYTRGDVVWSTVYFLNTDTADIRSRVVYVELLSPDGEVLLQERLRREGNRAEWSYQIPFDWQDGTYVCRFYTLWNLNFSPPVVYQYPFRILAGAGSGGPAPDYRDWEPQQMVVGSLPVQLSVETDQGSYQAGDTVRVYIEATQGMGNPVSGSFSASVTDAAWIPPYLATRANLRAAVNTYQGINYNYSDRYEAETGLRTEGRVYLEDGETPLETSYLSLHLVESNRYFQTQTENGYYRYALPDFYGPQNAQIHNLNPYQPPLPQTNPFNPAEELEFDVGILRDAARPDSLTRNRYLFLTRQQRRFRELFGQPSLLMRVAPVNSISVGTPDEEYDMADYQRLETVAEFIDEIILTARLKGKDTKRDVYLLNADTYDRFSRPAWFQVDGFLISDAAYALAIPFTSVEEVSVYNSMETIAAHFPSVLSSFGVIGIHTRDGSPPAGLEDVSNRFRIPGYHYPLDFEPPPAGRAPDFRPLVHWQAAIRTDESGRAYFEFPVTDARGVFTIQVEGVSVRGEAGSGYAAYVVE